MHCCFDLGFHSCLFCFNSKENMAANATAGNMSSNATTAENEWDMTYHTTLTILAFIIVIVNVPVVVLYFNISSLRHSAGNTFLVGLALADILCACFMIPTGIACDVRLLGDDHQTNVCIFYYVSNLTLSLGSIYHIVAATVAKYFAIVHPMRNITACTKPRVNFIVASIWIVSFLVGHIPFYIKHMGTKDEEIMHKHAIFLIVFAFAIPTFILICIHVHIYLRLFLNSRPGALIAGTNTRSENNRRIAILFFLLFLFFIISWLPWYLLWAEFIHPRGEVHNALAILRFLAPVINPLMFTFAKRDFRKAAVSLVSRLRGRQPDFSSRRSYHTQATSSVDRTNFIDKQNIERSSKVERPEREETTVNEPEEMQII